MYSNNNNNNNYYYYYHHYYYRFYYRSNPKRTTEVVRTFVGMNVTRIPKILYEWELEGRSRRGRQSMSWKD